MSRLLRGIKTEGLRLRLVDAREQVVGRLASNLAVLLQGKDKPSYSPWKEDGDILVVTNAKHVVLTGKKWDQKLYRWHTGYPGGLKERTAKKEFEKDPASILRRAVYGMLPKNRLRKERARKLRIFPGEEHPFADHPDLVPWEMPQRRRRIKEALFELPEGYEPLNSTVYRKRFGHMLPGDMSVLFERGESSGTIPALKSGN